MDQIRNFLSFEKSIDPSLVTTRRLYPALQIAQNTLSVQRTQNQALKISFQPNNCAFNLRPLAFRQTFFNSAYVSENEKENKHTIN